MKAKYIVYSEPIVDSSSLSLDEWLSSLGGLKWQGNLAIRDSDLFIIERSCTVFIFLEGPLLEVHLDTYVKVLLWF